MAQKMKGAVLPGNSTALLKEFDVPEPGPGQALVKMKASTICGSDIRAIYREHLGKGPEAYQNVIAGHEPCGRIVKAGAGLKRFGEGDRVIVYHISGCGVCYDCRRGYMISCRSEHRQAYGWQRDGGMADYLLADEKDLVPLPEPLSYVDGAQVACGFGTSYEALTKLGVSGNDRVLVTGLGPVGMATLMLARAMGARRLVGVDVVQERLDLVRRLGLADQVYTFSDDLESRLVEEVAPQGLEKTVDCPGNGAARRLAVRAASSWGDTAFVGEGGDVHLEPSPDMIHGQKTVYGSWVTSIWLMEELVERLVSWGIHPHDLVTDRFPLDRVDEAYALMAGGKCGKVAVVFDEELKA
ncbi:MAG: zinc-dependent alcohol dehydrogenase family protein [Spirochaetota bacterium]